MRRDAVYPWIVVGKPVQEDAWLGKATERIFLPAIKMTVSEFVDYDLPVSGAHNCVIVSIKKSFPGHAHKVMHAISALGMLSLSKAVVVVDAHMNVHNLNEVFFYVGATSIQRDVVIAEGPLTISITLRRCSSSAARSGSTRPRRGRTKERASGRRRSR